MAHAHLTPHGLGLLPQWGLHSSDDVGGGAGGNVGGGDVGGGNVRGGNVGGGDAGKHSTHPVQRLNTHFSAQVRGFALQNGLHSAAEGGTGNEGVGGSGLGVLLGSGGGCGGDGKGDGSSGGSGGGWGARGQPRPSGAGSMSPYSNSTVARPAS